MARHHSYGSALCRTGTTSVLAFAAMTLASTAAAHPGHGVTPEGDSAVHYLLEPLHGIGIAVVLVAAAVAVLVSVIRSSSARRSSQQ